MSMLNKTAFSGTLLSLLAMNQITRMSLVRLDDRIIQWYARSHLKLGTNDKFLITLNLSDVICVAFANDSDNYAPAPKGLGDRHEQVLKFLFLGI